MADKAIVVTDLGYGDSGKGTMVDYLVRQAPSVVIRHNGGAQAAHNVVLPDGRHHTFSQFGSGSFLNDVPTYLSRYMLVNPLYIFTESQQLNGLDVTDVMQRLVIDADAKVVTPWHLLTNQLRELARGADRHGSCGHGVGEAMADAIDHPELTIYIRNLYDGTLPDRLAAVRNHKFVQAKELARQSEPGHSLLAEFMSNDLFANTASIYRTLVGMVQVVETDYLDYLARSYDQLVFEGAQGVLLDEWYGFHPYTTWSTTGHHNAEQLLGEVGFDGEIIRLGVVRSYMTRHGAGPFVTEDTALDAQMPEPHNGNNVWQHGFRVGHPDMVALRYALEVIGGADALALTHLDRAKDISRVATTYTMSEPVDSSLFDAIGQMVTRIIPGSIDELDRQEAITQALMSAQPNYQQFSATADMSVAEGLTSVFMNELTLPVCYTSNGPTWADKHALVAC